MEFIAILICLAVERWTDFGLKVRDFQLLEKYIGFIRSIFGSLSIGWVLLLVILLPIIVVIGLIYLIFLQFYYGLLGLILAICVLFYCLGPFVLTKQGLTVDTALVQVNRNIFSVLFWFALLGPVGAILYRLNNLLVSEKDSNLSVAAERFQTILEWIPVRLEVLSYALVSHFGAVIKCLMKKFLSGLSENEQLLVSCSNVAINPNATDIPKEVVGLMDRALIIWLVVIALIILL